MSYDIKFRQKVIEYIRAGHTDRETAKTFGISTSTLWEWKSQLKEVGTIASKKRKETWRKIDPEALKKYLKENPDAYLKEIAEEFECSDVAIMKALRRLKISRKKNDSIQGNK